MSRGISALAKVLNRSAARKKAHVEWLKTHPWEVPSGATYEEIAVRVKAHRSDRPEDDAGGQP